MTENKQYTCDIHRIFDNEKQLACADTMDDAEIIADKLNQQQELISEQSIQLDYLKDENKHMGDVLHENKQLKERIKELEKEIKENLEKAVKQDEWVDNLIQHGDSWKKIEDNVTEFYAIMMACSDYPIALKNYSSIDELIQGDDFEETMKYYRGLAKQRISFNRLSENDGDVDG